MEVINELRKLTGLSLSHSENLSDATSNLDRWVEIHATLKAHAVNLVPQPSSAGWNSAAVPMANVGIISRLNAVA